MVKKKNGNDPISKAFNSIGKFGDTKFKIKNVEFSITKLPPMDGFEMAEKIRLNLVYSADRFDVKSNPGEKNKEVEQNAILFFKAILGIETEFVKEIREKLFEHIQFSGNGVEKGWMDLRQSEDMAFENFEIINIYEVLGRALFVNFSGSFSELTSNFPGMAQILSQQLQKT